MEIQFYDFDACLYNSEEERSISSLSSVEDEKKTQQDFANKEKR